MRILGGDHCNARVFQKKSGQNGCVALEEKQDFKRKFSNLGSFCCNKQRLPDEGRRMEKTALVLKSEDLYMIKA